MSTIATASRGDVTVTVGGVGRIVTGNVAAIELPGSSSSSSASTTGSTSGSSSSAPPDAVFARTTGHIARLLVQPGRRVTAGQALAVIDDNGVSASATRQAQLDLETARVELDQKLRSDPQKGVPPTAAELAAAHASVGSARADLAQVTGRTHAADVAAARADVRRAQADVQALQSGPPPPAAVRSRSLRSARPSRRSASTGCSRPPRRPMSAPPRPRSRKAESDLAVLQKPPATPLPEE